jgi:hypothetical protein
MNAAAGAARSEDISSLKEAILSYAAVHSPEGELRPQINLSSSKSNTRGLNHPMLARLLCPIQYLDQFDENPERCIYLMSLLDLSHSPLTRTILDLQEGRIRLTSEDFPAFMYAAGMYDPHDMEIGLLRHEFPLAVSPGIAGVTIYHLCYRSGDIFSKHHLLPYVPLDPVLHLNRAKRRCTTSKS